jgi:uncharacterized peroxidase-related enzyme
VSRLPQLTPDDATDRQRDLLDATRRQLGRVPNLYRTMANSPAALNGYLAFRAALAEGVLKPALREQLALLVAELNSCRYCVAAHSLRGAKLGMSDEVLLDVRSARHADPLTQAALQFARAVVAETGDVSDETLASARAAGITDAELAEVVAHVALNTYSNVFNHVAQPELDFPAVAPINR